MRYLFIILLGIYGCSTPKEAHTPLPNIMIIYADDLGFGDIGINGAKGVETPNIDFLARNGVNHLDAHCSAATCTPSRYSLLTGSYAFRNNAAVLPGDAPLIIDQERGTLPSMLKEAGYTTGVVGKWHLGLGICKVDWNKEITPGPREIGFDYSFLIPATGDRVPCVFVENQKVVGLEEEDPIRVNYSDRLEDYPIGLEHPEMLKQQADPQHSKTIINGVSRIGYMSGGENALWKDEEFPLILTDKARDFMSRNQEKPFFLYFSFHDIHVPRIPNKQFVGKSKMGPRGDAIAQMDWCVGALVDYLRENEMLDNTLIIFSSDNGPVLDDGYEDQAVEMLGMHQPAGPFRGAKYSAYEAGTRMPTIVHWPGKVNKGQSTAVLSQVDLYASLARLTGSEVKEGDAPDSEDYLDAWLGQTNNGRDVLIEESFTLAIRKGDWKYIEPQSSPTPDWLKNKDVESGLSPDKQLFNIKSDPSETTNLALDYPEKVEAMHLELQGIIER